MPKVTKAKVQKVLTEVLGLREPRFKLEVYGGMVSGSVISPSFQGKSDRRRREMIVDAIDDALGKEGAGEVGMILAYTPEEWDVDLVVPIANVKARR
jgi:acid stress-induced BolA-like protein IbaG/YrbA